MKLSSFFPIKAITGKDNAPFVHYLMTEKETLTKGEEGSCRRQIENLHLTPLILL
jgi:hypothetical protein